MSKSLNLVVAATLLLVSVPAFAFNQTMTCIDAEDRDPLAPTSTPTCSGNEIPNPFSWPSWPVRYRINSAGSQTDFPTDDGQIDGQLRDAIIASFEEWNQPDCSPFEFVEGELTEVDAFNPQDDVNLVVFQNEEWPYSSRSIALSSVSVRPDGEIVDVDLELNGVQFRFTDQEDGVAGAYDIRNTITHEAGHVLGLDHSPIADATMQFNAAAGQTKKRDLHPDDIEGLCFIYSSDQRPEPPIKSEDDGCCAQVVSTSRTSPLALLVLLGLLALRRRYGS